jgi:serine/threonine protein kinase
MLLTKNGHLKLADFGVSQLFPEHAEERGQHGGSASTPAFTAPEIINREHGEYHAKNADIWAMGVTLFVFAFGRLPFNADNSFLMYECIDADAVVIPCDDAGTCPMLSDLLTKLLVPSLLFPTSASALFRPTTVSPPTLHHTREHIG